MKTLEEITKIPRLIVQETGLDGGRGIIHMPRWVGSVVWSNSGGWDHVSIAPAKRNIMPSWDDMCLLKNLFFNEDEVVIQYHPAKKDYVNNLSNCLHLWKPTEETLPVPNSLMVGLKDGQTTKDLNDFAKSIEQTL